MSTAALKTAATGNGVAKKEPQTFPQFLQAQLPEIARALPKHLNADRMARIALTEFRKNKKLAECDPKSVFAAVIMLSQMGLEPGMLGQAYLIPYGKECQAIPGWKGLVDLVSRTGRATVSTQAVYPGDEFDYEFGTTPFLKHKPSGQEPEHRADFTHVYAVGRVRGAEEPIFEVWTRERIIKHRDRFNKVGDKHYSFQHFEMYARKVVLLQVLKYLPASAELQTSMELEDAAERSGQGLDLTNVIDGTWSAVPEGDATTSQQEPESGTASTEKSSQQLTFDSAKALAAIKNCKTLSGLDAEMTTIAHTLTVLNIAMPVDVEAARNEKREALAKI